MKKRIFNIIIIIILCIFFILGYFLLYNEFHIGIPCLFYEITGLYCPGCGITRCIFFIIKGNIYEAFKYNQLIFFLLPFLVFYILVKIYYYITNKENVLIKKIPNYTYIILLIITLSYGILRNLPSFPFLRP